MLTLKTSAKYPECNFHGGNTGSNPVGDAKPFLAACRVSRRPFYDYRASKTQ